jgi:hypothetical protein
MAGRLDAVMLFDVETQNDGGVIHDEVSTMFWRVPVSPRPGGERSDHRAPLRVAAILKRAFPFSRDPEGSARITPLPSASRLN